MDKTIEPITDDAELAKVLEGMQGAPAAAPAIDGLQFETTAPAAAPVADTSQVSSLPTADMLPTAAPAPASPSVPAPLPAPQASSSATGSDPALESIKKDALEQLRPLVDKLNLPADEKFDTLLLIIRSTDDKSLVGSAYTAATLIPDESKRAEAMLDIIKEIDYFSNPASAA